jgi:hypothetical protein
MLLSLINPVRNIRPIEDVLGRSDAIRPTGLVVHLLESQHLTYSRSREELGAVAAGKVCHRYGSASEQPSEGRDEALLGVNDMRVLEFTVLVPPVR